MSGRYARSVGDDEVDKPGAGGSCAKSADDRCVDEAVRTSHHRYGAHRILMGVGLTGRKGVLDESWYLHTP